jgi:lysophospholipase L1-like esterase
MEKNVPAKGLKRRFVTRAMIGLFAVSGVIAFSVFGFLYWQGTQEPNKSGEYVALGSSFAAGIGLGQRVPGSPIHCFRTTAGYPTLVAKQAGRRLVDMSCSGSTTQHILSGGQLLLGAQLAAIGSKTTLVTITTGGNDVDYIGDLMAASGNMGSLGSWWHGDIRPADARPYGIVTQNLKNIVSDVREKAPNARIFIVNYPTLVPPKGTCAALGINETQADISRDVARQLALATKRAADETGVQLIDIANASLGHDVCSKVPWVNGASVENGTAFHPNSAGAAATAGEIVKALLPRTTKKESN